MAKFVILFVCLAVIQTSYALKCKKCGNTECDIAKLVEDVCPTPPTDMKVGCLTEVMMDASKKTTTTRKCANFPKTQDKYACVTVPGSKNERCDTCFEDLCNSAPSIQFSFFAMTGVAVALLVSKFL